MNYDFNLDQTAVIVGSEEEARQIWGDLGLAYTQKFVFADVSDSNNAKIDPVGQMLQAGNGLSDFGGSEGIWDVIISSNLTYVHFSLSDYSSSGIHNYPQTSISPLTIKSRIMDNVEGVNAFHYNGTQRLEIIEEWISPQFEQVSYVPKDGFFYDPASPTIPQGFRSEQEEKFDPITYLLECVTRLNPDEIYVPKQTHIDHMALSDHLPEIFQSNVSGISLGNHLLDFGYNGTVCIVQN